MPYLSLLIFLPLLAAVGVLALPNDRPAAFRWVTLGASLFNFALTIFLWVTFDKSSTGFQFTERADWITLSLGPLGVVSIDYFLGVDGLSLPLVVLSGLVLAVGAISSFEIRQKQKAYFALYLLLSASIMGCFVALDLFLFFLFFEFMLLPMYFLIGLWGGQRREYASIKFFIYTLLGSLCILLVFIALYLSVADPIETALRMGMTDTRTGINGRMLADFENALQNGGIPGDQVVHTFSLPYLLQPTNYLPDSLLNLAAGNVLFGYPARVLAFWLLVIGFAIKLPAVPLHTWLPDAHVEAPTPVSVVLAGVLLKIGGYGLFRIAWAIFPEEAVASAPWLGGLGVLSIGYGALNALAQKDLKRLIAYSSVSHMGFVLLGLASLTAEGLNGAIYQMVSHGVLSAMLFLIAGVLYARTHDRLIGSYRGLAVRMPGFVALTAVAFFGSLGLPGLSGFIGEFFALMGTFNSPYLPTWMAPAGTLGILLGAAYFLWALQRMFFGTFWSVHDPSVLTDVTTREKVMLIPLAALALVMGILPNLLLSVTEGAVGVFLSNF